MLAALGQNDNPFGPGPGGGRRDSLWGQVRRGSLGGKIRRESISGKSSSPTCSGSSAGSPASIRLKQRTYRDELTRGRHSALLKLAVAKHETRQELPLHPCDPEWSAPTLMAPERVRPRQAWSRSAAEGGASCTPGRAPSSSRPQPEARRAPTWRDAPQRREPQPASKTNARPVCAARSAPGARAQPLKLTAGTAAQATARGGAAPRVTAASAPADTPAAGPALAPELATLSFTRPSLQERAVTCVTYGTYVTYVTAIADVPYGRVCGSTSPPLRPLHRHERPSQRDVLLRLQERVATVSTVTFYLVCRSVSRRGSGEATSSSGRTLGLWRSRSRRAPDGRGRGAAASLAQHTERRPGACTTLHEPRRPSPRARAPPRRRQLRRRVPRRPPPFARRRSGRRGCAC